VSDSSVENYDLFYINVIQVKSPEPVSFKFLLHHSQSMIKSNQII